ncbi:MAG: ribonuclease III [Tunicatimonas sp.]
MFFPRFTGSSQDRKLARAIRHIVGRRPANLALYRLATQHVSVAKKNRQGVRESNERLEYLGDAVLSMVVAEYLFKKFPFKDEGFLTEIRSRIVNRESLNQVARKLGVSDIVQFSEGGKHGRNGRNASGGGASKGRRLSHKSIGGNTLEALVGAVYLDRGYRAARRFILKKMLIPHFDLLAIVENDTNYKSKVIEWAQKHNRDVRYEVVETRGGKQYKEFITQLLVDDQPVSTGSGYSKKKAEQRASEKALSLLGSML